MSKKELVKEAPQNAEGDDIVLGATTNTSIMPQVDDSVKGDFDTSDIRFPYLSLTQGVGPLSELFKKGQVILNGETMLADPGNQIELTVCKIAKHFEENLPYGGDDIPRIALTKEDVLRMGGVTEWNRDENGNSVPPSWKAIAEAMVCIKQPEGAPDEAFPYPFQKDNYTFAVWKIKGVAYRRAAVEIFSAATLYYRAGLRTGSFLMNSEKQVFGQNTVYVPRVVKGTKNSDEFVSWLSEFV
tara:strand:- start:55 stop:780 length:726 start_codon:yes stop_codon:yes gene_type:complete